MTYELAKKLKEAGFPLFCRSHEMFLKNCDEWRKEGGLNNEVECDYLPTLSELIEACGDRFERLFCMDKDTVRKLRMREARWLASANKLNKYHHNKEIKEGWGRSPEIAVANLYLALHKND